MALKCRPTVTPHPHAEWPPFEERLAEHGLSPLRAVGVEVLQVNLGKRCNQTCRHCHVDAGPGRMEMMDRPTVQACLDVLAQTEISTLDVTGGAPEMHPQFRWLVEQARGLGRHVIDRCNLTILTEPGYTDLPEFLAGQGVEIVASLPCYLAENVDAQRGDDVMERSLEALHRLGELGYGLPDSPLVLSLVHNPAGASLPGDQAALEADYRRELKTRYGIEFTRLLAIANMPINRFLQDLVQGGQYESYMKTLCDAFNPAAAANVMCRTTLSVDWRGRLFDCDFNQMLGLTLEYGLPQHIAQYDASLMLGRAIRTASHCYGCTAAAGSGCQGALTEADDRGTSPLADV